MRRDKFITEDAIGKHTDVKTGMTLFPYRDRIVKSNTIWRSKTSPVGMLMIHEQVQGYNHASRNFDGEDAWDVKWRRNDGKEEMAWTMTSKEILDKFDPVFSVL